MKQEHVHSAIHSASVETSRFLSAHLRGEARASGWPDHIVRHMSVSYSGDGFNVHAHNQHHSEIGNLEYGTPGTQPTAAIRRFANRTGEAEQFFAGRVAARLGI